MPQLTESAAEKLTTEQAVELVRILDLQARWENHRDDPAKDASSFSDLQARQKAFDAFRVAWRKYAADYRNALLPEPTQNVPDRLAIWCRSLRAVLRRAENGSATQVVAKVHRLADRIAARTGKEPVGRTSVADFASAVRELDTVIVWCDGLAALPGVLDTVIHARTEDAA